MTIRFTRSAQEYLHELLKKQDTEGVAVRVFVNSPGTPRAETCLAYCNPGEEHAEDTQLEGLLIPVLLDAPSLPYLEDASVDHKTDELGGGQLTILAPNARLPQMRDDSPVTERIDYVLQSEINPGLAAHGGFVRLVEFNQQAGEAVLQFGGGCQGCGMIDLTLKEGVEATLKARVPELAKVRDVTDHSDSEGAYYK